MKLNNFLKADRQKAERMIESTQNLISELPAAIEEQDFEGCVEIAASIISHCKDLKRMEHPEQVVRFRQIAAKFAGRGLNVSAVGRPFQ